MKTVIFKTKEYQLLSFDVISSRFSASLVRGEYDVDTLLNEVETSESITVKEDGETIGVYNGYTELLALSVHAEDISVEIINRDIQMQIDAISQAQTEQGQEIDSLENNINVLENNVANLTPYEETKKAYFGEHEKTFYNVPEGNVLVFFDNYNGTYSIERVGNRLTVSFDTLEHETNVTISIQ